MIIAAGSLVAQDLPSYSERVFQHQLDSLRATTSIYSTGASEGSIDPHEYHVGPGDKLFISISGVREFIYNLSINQEGWIYIPQVGGVDLNNLTMAQARTKLENSINRYYKDVNIFISLVDFRQIRVSLVGDVVKPSNFVLAANSRLMDLFSISAGLNKTANIRNIKIISKEDSVKFYDLLSFLRFGNFDSNPLLREGDVVLVDRADETVTITGLVKYPGIYEYVENESVYDLIKLTGGFLSKAKKDTIEVVRFYDNGSHQKSNFYTLDYITNNDLLLKNKDHVIIREIPEYYIEYFVIIDGFVKFPGYYKIVKDKTTLKDIIEQAGGFLEEASLTETILTRNIDKEKEDPEFERLKLINPADMSEDEYDYFKARSRERSGRVVVDFEKLFEQNDQNENVILKKGDVIRIPEEKNYITMLGQLVNPGNIIYNPSLTVNDYIELAGGFGWRAQEAEVRVIKAKSGEWMYADQVDKLNPGDAIWVPEEPPATDFWEVFNTTLQVLAQVAAIVAATAAIIIATR
ncbi:MAG: SLBB domain-containing protein [Bacteroidetes bacterium]|nr:SLBB domain-containing protein [Bacteroidota bacterium]